MITKEDLNTLAKRRAELEVTLKRLTPSQERQAEIEAHKQAFFEKGGKIVHIERHVSGISRENNLTLREAKEFEIKRQRAITSNVARNRKTAPTEITYGTFLGAHCPKCGNQKRYLSNADCVVCAKERRERNAATMKHNTRRRDAKADQA